MEKRKKKHLLQKSNSENVIYGNALNLLMKFSFYKIVPLLRTLSMAKLCHLLCAQSFIEKRTCYFNTAQLIRKKCFKAVFDHIFFVRRKIEWICKTTYLWRLVEMLDWFLVPWIPCKCGKWHSVFCQRNESMKAHKIDWINEFIRSTYLAFICATIPWLRRCNFQCPFIGTFLMHGLEPLIRWIGQYAYGEYVQITFSNPWHL